MTDQTHTHPVETGQKKAEDTAEAIKARAGTLKEDAQRTAQSLASGAKSRVEAEVTARTEGARDAVAGAIEDTAETLRTAAERMSDGTPQSEAVHRAANTVYGVATQVRQADVASLTEDLSSVARRYPVPFMAGAAILGFAAGRFMKATQPSSYDSYDYDRPAPARYPVPAPAPSRALTPTSRTAQTSEGTLETDGPATTPKPLPTTPQASSAAAGSTGGSSAATSSPISKDAASKANGPTPTARPVPTSTTKEY